ncbi:MAG TPA: glycine cleavage system aminomethyltransferase GcvT [Syntrophomonas sp.]|nr:glycine cleavage system aminomethyltransferase GcvT [Syntrophomonas sp.]HCF72102.1 glycine cleavage system aminomethyltransferase GcvT [Syntrophomonas sp.]
MGLKRTPLYMVHQKYGGKIIDFGGWELPVQYDSIIKEHQMVREKAGLFDVSHMGEIGVTGEKAEDFINHLVTNDITTLKDRQIQYSPMCYENGGVVDDLLIYRYDPQHFLLVVNASNCEKDFAWIKEHAYPGVDIIDRSGDYAQLAVQGPLAQSILQKLTDTALDSIKFFWFLPAVKVAGIECIVSRTGYTGEDGFELYCPAEDACVLWEEILAAGGEDIAPIGLGARDTLRFEAKLPLYGQEMDQDITPLEAGLNIFVKLDRGDFIGRDALLEQKNNNSGRVLAEFEMTGRGIPRSHYHIQKNGQDIGWVTTGMHSPTFGKGIGLALIPREYSAPGEEIDIVIRDKPVKARIGKGIFYSKKTRRNK